MCHIQHYDGSLVTFIRCEPVAFGTVPPQYPFLPVSVPVIITVWIDGVWSGIESRGTHSYYISATPAPLGVGGFT